MCVCVLVVLVFTVVVCMRAGGTNIGRVFVLMVPSLVKCVLVVLVLHLLCVFVCWWYCHW